MRATFRNKLAVVEGFNGDKRIKYNHPFRLDLEFFVEKRGDSNDNSNRDWDITLKARNEAMIKQMRSELARSFVQYVKSRTRHDVNALTFDEIENLAKMWSIQ